MRESRQGVTSDGGDSRATFLRGAARWDLILAVSFFLVNCIGLDRSPVVWIDEVAMNDPAKELALHGRYRSSVFAGHAQFEDVYLWVPPGQPLVVAGAYAIAGFGIWQTRIPPLLFGAAVLLLVGASGRRIFHDPRGAFLAALLLALDPQFMQTARAGRMDTQCLFFALLAFILLLRSLDDERRRAGWYLVIGACIGAALLTSPVAAPWSISIGLLILIQGGKKRVRSFLLFCAGAGATVLPWVLYAFQTPEAFHQQFFSLVGEHVPALSLADRFTEEFIRYWRVYRTIPMELALFVAAGIWIAATNTRPGKVKWRIVLPFLTAFLFNMLFMGKLGGYYSLHPNVFLLIAGGMLAAHMVRATAAVRHLRFLTAGMLILLATNLLAGGIGGRLLTLAYQWKDRDYGQVVEAIADNVPAGSVVWGTEGVWYAVETCGSTLRLLGEPDAASHDFLILRKNQNRTAPPGFKRIGEYGRPLSPVLGRFTVNSFDYRIVVWKSELRGRAPQNGTAGRGGE